MNIDLNEREVLLLRLGLADQIINAGRVDTPSPSARATVIAELAALDSQLAEEPVDLSRKYWHHVNLDPTDNSPSNLELRDIADLDGYADVLLKRSRP
jgi:hypothetical protein